MLGAGIIPVEEEEEEEVAPAVGAAEEGGGVDDRDEERLSVNRSIKLSHSSLYFDTK